MQRLQPEMRYNANTTMVARGVSSAVGGTLSPVQIDSLVRGYFSWLGAFAVGFADLAIRYVGNEPDRPQLDYPKFFTGGMVADVQSGSSRYVSQLYAQAAEIEQAFATHRQLMKEGKRADAKEFATEHKELLGQYRSVEAIKRQLSAMNERIRMIERSDMHPAEKRIQINKIKERESDLAQKLVR